MAILRRPSASAMRDVRDRLREAWKQAFALVYYNDQSGLASTNVQDAIDELAAGSGGGGGADILEVQVFS